MWTKYGRGRQVTDENIIRRMRFPLWMIKAKESLSEIKLINYFLATATMFCERVSILRLYARCLPCYIVL